MQKRTVPIVVILFVCLAIIGFASQLNVLSYASESNSPASQLDSGGSVLGVAGSRGATPLSVTVKPEANKLTYNAALQKLVTPGEASGGTMQYAIGDSDTDAPTSGWSPEIPEKGHSGTYFVWYKAVGDGDSAPECVVVKIAKRTVRIIANDRRLRYNGQIQGPGDAVYEDPAEVSEWITVEGLQGNDYIANVTVDGQGDLPGVYPLIPTSAPIYGDSVDPEVDDNSSGLRTDNYEREYVDGRLIIFDYLKVTVTGSSAEATFNGKEQAYEGTVTATSADEAFDVSKFHYNGNTVVKGIKAGEYVIELVRENCVYDDEVYMLDCVFAKPIKLTIKPADDPENKPADKEIGGTLLAKLVAKGETTLVLTWNKIKGADGYDVFFAKCGKGDKAFKKVKTINAGKKLKWTKKKLKRGKSYKAYVKAWIIKDGKKVYVKASLKVHAYASGGTAKSTNPKSVSTVKSASLEKGETFKIKAKVAKLQKGKKLIGKGHAPKLRYVSSDTKVASVSSSGKITGKAAGSCKVYVVAVNGARKIIEVTVR